MTPIRKLDIEANLQAKKYSLGENLLRLLWGAAHPLFRLSPQHLYAWRRLLLKAFGAKIGRGVRIDPRARILFPWKFSIGDLSIIGNDTLVYNLGPITLGNQVTVSHGVQLCAGTHDHRDPAFALIKSTVDIEDCAWICTEAFVGPGVRIGEGAIVGARAVAMKDVASWDIVIGNPAHVIGQRELRATKV